MPGSWKEPDDCSEAAAEAEDGGVLASGAAVPASVAAGVVVEGVVVEGNVEAVELVPVGTSVTVDRPLTRTPDAGNAVDEANDAPLDVETPVETTVEVPVAAEASKLVDVPITVLVAGGSAVSPAVTVVKVVEEELADPPPASPVPEPPYAREHFLTSSTAGCPFLSVIGVRVITHVSVNGPAFV